MHDRMHGIIGRFPDSSIKNVHSRCRALHYLEVDNMCSVDCVLMNDAVADNLMRDGDVPGSTIVASGFAERAERARSWKAIRSDDKQWIP